MIAYKAPAYRMSSYKPAPLSGRRLGQETLTGAQIKTTGVGLGLLSTTLSGAAAWVGLHTGMKEGGLLGIAGWVVGLTGGLLGAISFLGTVSLLLTPTEELDRAAREGMQRAAPHNPNEVTTAQMPILQEVP